MATLDITVTLPYPALNDPDDELTEYLREYGDSLSRYLNLRLDHTILLTTTSWLTTPELDVVCVITPDDADISHAMVHRLVYEHHETWSR